MGREYSPTPPVLSPSSGATTGGIQQACDTYGLPCAAQPVRGPLCPIAIPERTKVASHLSLKERAYAREGLKAAGQDTPHLGDGQTVVDDGHACPLAGTYATGHLPLTEHAGTAVHHEVEAGWVMGKLCARRELEVRTRGGGCYPR